MKILVAPLDWGLGHATRCVPVIREFLKQGAEVELAVVRSNASLLRGFFPELRQRLAPSYNIVYPKHGYNMGLWLLKNGTHLNSVIRFEHRFAEEMVERHHYDLLLSDNRFGFYSRKAKSIYMTHQRRIAFPPMLSAFESVGMLWHAAVMKRFDEVWVPDLEETPGYAGSMSHVRYCPKPVKYVGALSRFMTNDADSVNLTRDVNSANLTSDASSADLTSKAASADCFGFLQENSAAETCLNVDGLPGAKRYDFVAVVSGVEPARSRFEKRLKEIFEKIPGRHAIIQGKPALGLKHWAEGNVDFFTHLLDDEFAAVVKSSQWVISRGGYSTVMDMAVLGVRGIFVPTPGQYEQVVLGRDLANAGYASCIGESKLTAEMLMQVTENSKCVMLPRPPSESPLASVVKSALKNIK